MPSLSKRALVGIALCAVTIALGWVIAKQLVDYQEHVEFQAEVALAMTFINMAEDPTFEVYEVTGAPLALKTKDQLTLFYLLRAAEFGRERESDAFFQLALYFLRRGDCALVEHYLKLHLGAAGDRHGVREALEALQGQDCRPEITDEIGRLVGVGAPREVPFEERRRRSKGMLRGE